jgi:DNA polymerase III psi subunit
MDNSVDVAGSEPLAFPSTAKEARSRAMEFRRLTADERWKEIADLMEIGMNMVRSSPRRAEIEKRMEAQEAEWQQIQQRLFSQHGA